MQSFHQTTKYWPVPVRQGVLVEIEFAEVDTQLELLNGNLRNLPTARVRTTSPLLNEDYQEILLPGEKAPGAVGVRVLISEGNLIYLRESEYAAAGLTARARRWTKPDEEFGEAPPWSDAKR